MVATFYPLMCVYRENGKIAAERLTKLNKNL